MVDYAFYAGTYRGNSIPGDEFNRLVARARAQLDLYKRNYRVRSPRKNSEELALCAMADALYYFETVQNGGMVTSAKIGSVSSSQQAGAADISPKAQAAELYRCARLYLDIYRGCR